MAARRTPVFSNCVRLRGAKDERGCRSIGRPQDGVWSRAVLLVVANVLLDIRAMARDESQIPEDPTPIVAAPTDIAPLTHKAPKPPHERTADEEADVIDW